MFLEVAARQREPSVVGIDAKSTVLEKRNGSMLQKQFLSPRIQDIHDTDFSQTVFRRVRIESMFKQNAKVAEGRPLREMRNVSVHPASVLDEEKNARWWSFADGSSQLRCVECAMVQSSSVFKQELDNSEIGIKGGIADDGLPVHVAQIGIVSEFHEMFDHREAVLVRCIGDRFGTPEIPLTRIGATINE